jgi:hypothetical protein
MPGSPKIAVTPQRVADGDPAALVRLVDRRARAVLAFCETVCTYEVAPLAAAEAFARFRAAVQAAEDPRSLDPETLLHGATRHAAGGMARSASSETRRRLGRRGDEHLRCIPTPGLLAARADNMLGVAEDERLSEHLQRCAGCRAVEARFNRAEQAYLRRSSGEMDPLTVLAILEALHDAAPIAAQYEHDWDEVLSDLARAAGAEEIDEELESGFDDETEDDQAEELLDEPLAEEAEPEPQHEPEAEAEPEPEIDLEPGPGLEPELPEPEPELESAPEPDPEPEPEPHEDEPELYDDPYDEPEAGDDGQVPSAVPAGRPEGNAGIAARALSSGKAVFGGVRSRTRGRELPRPFRHTPQEVADHGLIYRYVLPATALLVAALIILAVAGVFSAGGSQIPNYAH